MLLKKTHQIAGTEVLPSIWPISARTALPSDSLSSSMTVYLAPFSSRITFAVDGSGRLKYEAQKRIGGRRERGVGANEQDMGVR